MSLANAHAEEDRQPSRDEVAQELDLSFPSEHPYAALTAAGVVVGDLLMQYSPALQDGRIEIVRIARLPGLMTKVAVRPTRRFQGGPHPVGLVVGTGAVHLQPILERLGGEALRIVRWRREPEPFIADALWLSYRPTMLLETKPDGHRRATVLLGEVDAIGAMGKQGSNLRTASWLTGWRIRIHPLVSAPEWQMLEEALRTGAPLPARALERTPKGLIVEVAGLRGLLPFGRLCGIDRGTPEAILERRVTDLLVTRSLLVHVQRMDPDFGRLFVVEAPPSAHTLAMPLSSSS